MLFIFLHNIIYRTAMDIDVNLSEYQIDILLRETNKPKSFLLKATDLQNPRFKLRVRPRLYARIMRKSALGKGAVVNITNEFIKVNSKLGYLQNLKKQPLLVLGDQPTQKEPDIQLLKILG